MSNPKYFICPMSKNIVDALLQMNDDRFGILPTRRQIDYDGGYVNEWNTQSFFKYINSSNWKGIVERDHSGPNQGKSDDDGIDSYREDSKYFDIIHIDPWKAFPSLIDGIQKTIDGIRYIHCISPTIQFEIGTEEAIRPMSVDEMTTILKTLQNKLSPSEFKQIRYAVIQSGVGLDLESMTNTGVFNLHKLKKMVSLVHSYGLQTKEHNGDYLTNEEYRMRFSNGVNAINIGPEIAQIETMTYLDYMSHQQIDEYYEVCYTSHKWEKWIPNGFDFTNKIKLIQICGHYCFGQYQLPDITSIIKERLFKKLNSLPL